MVTCEVSKETTVSIEKMLPWVFADTLRVQRQRETAAKISFNVDDGGTIA